MNVRMEPMTAAELAALILEGLEMADQLRDPIKDGRLPTREATQAFLSETFRETVERGGTNHQATCECGAIGAAVLEYFFPRDPQRN